MATVYTDKYTEPIVVSTAKSAQLFGAVTFGGLNIVVQNRTYTYEDKYQEQDNE